MDFEHLALKLYVSQPDELRMSAVTNAFHDFISSNALGELLIDTVDYTHVHQGPGVVLIGHASDYALDLSEGRPGLSCTRKRDHAPAASRAEDLLRRTLAAADKLEQRSEVGAKFRTDELCFTVADRLRLSRNPDPFAAAKEAWAPLLERVFGIEPSLSQEGDPRQPFTVRARLSTDLSASEALRRLS